MANRGSLRVADLFDWEALSVPGCIYPASQDAQQATPGASAQDDADGLLPWGCEPKEPSPLDQA